MNCASPNFKSVELCFRGFSLSPAQVESMIGIPAADSGTKGKPVKPDVKTILKRSFVNFPIAFARDDRLSEMISELLKHVGGVDHICEVRDKVLPEFLEINFILPVKGSEQQEGGFLPSATLAILCQLRASLSFSFT